MLRSTYYSQNYASIIYQGLLFEQDSFDYINKISVKGRAHSHASRNIHWWLLYIMRVNITQFNTAVLSVFIWYTGPIILLLEKPQGRIQH